MKRTLTYIVFSLVLASCLCGCGRNDGQQMGDTTMPAITAAPDTLPQPDGGIVTDGDGIIEKAEDDAQTHREDRDEDRSTVTASPKVSSTPSATASAQPKE